MHRTTPPDTILLSLLCLQVVVEFMSLSNHIALAVSSTNR
jgi:hypothetical protein